MKGNMNLYITRTITDTKTGKVIKRYRKKQAKSFVKAWMQLLEASMAHAYAVDADTVTIKDTGNTDRPIKAGEVYTNKSYCTESPVNNTDYGTLIGIGTTAPVVADYTIETLIAHGVGAGQMQYGACSVQSAVVSDSSMVMTITRAMVNGSGGSITVKEVGLAVLSQVLTYFFLILRDAVDDAVADGQTYTVTYTFTTTV